MPYEPGLYPGTFFGHSVNAPGGNTLDDLLRNQAAQPNPQAAPAGTAPFTTGPSTPFPTIPDFTLPDIASITAAINQMQQQGFQAAEGSRIPGQAGLEQESSAAIQGLLNPGEYFPGTSRESAELASLRGVAGSPAADSTWVRMTDAERLARMGLGQQFLTAALGRHPIGPQYDPSALASYLAQLPQTRAQLLTQQQQFAASQQQQRDLALAQMQNAYRIAQLQALHGGRALTGGGRYPNYGGGTAGTAGTGIAPVIPPVPSPTGEGWGVSSNNFNDAMQALNQGVQIPPNQGWDIPPDFGLEPFQDTESLYA